MLALNPALFIPDSPTLSPTMLLRQASNGSYPPFNHARVHWFYFARNAVWNCIRALGLDGFEVLVPAYHHGVEIEALMHAGACPVFYRIDRNWQVDLDDVERRIGPRTRALYLIHYAGFPGPLRAMREIADRHSLYLIEDCALSLLSSDNGVQLGTVGDFSIFCLYKTLPVPNGGALLVNHPAPMRLPALPPPPMPSVVSHTASSLLKNMALRGGRAGRWTRSLVRSLSQGVVRASRVERVPTGTMHFNPEHVDLGISPLSLRVARSQDFDWIVARRRENYFALRDVLGDVAPPMFERLPNGVCPLFYPVLTERKPELFDQLRAAGIEAIDFWRDHHPACDSREFPDVAWLRDRVLEIPCHQDLDAKTLQRMAAVVKHVCGGRRSAA